MTPFLFICATLASVDGDTAKGCGERVRLMHIDSAELRGPNPALAQAAKNELARLIDGRRVVCAVAKRDRYGRMLGDCEVGGVNLSRAMLDAGLAVPYKGGKRVSF